MKRCSYATGQYGDGRRDTVRDNVLRNADGMRASGRPWCDSERRRTLCARKCHLDQHCATTNESQSQGIGELTLSDTTSTTSFFSHSPQSPGHPAVTVPVHLLGRLRRSSREYVRYAQYRWICDLYWESSRLQVLAVCEKCMRCLL